MPKQTKLYEMLVHVAVDAMSGHGGEGTKPMSSMSFADSSTTPGSFNSPGLKQSHVFPCIVLAS